MSITSSYIDSQSSRSEFDSYFTQDISGNKQVGYKIDNNDIGYLYTDACGNFTRSDYINNFKYNLRPLNELFASNIKRPFVISDVAPILSGNYILYQYADLALNTIISKTFKIITTNSITTISGVQILCVGGGGQGGSVNNACAGGSINNACPGGGGQ